jgi:hypothetical protein
MQRRFWTVEADELLSDWTQANWELLVETAFKEILGERDVFLEPYGEGADCNDSSSRVWMPGATPTHRVMCHAREAANVRDELTDDTIELATGRVVFDQFATRADNGWYKVAPPFDCVLGYLDEREVLIPVDRISFALEQLGNAPHS